MTTSSNRPFFAERKLIVELAVKHRLPAIYFQKEFVDEGGLMFRVHHRRHPAGRRSW